MTADQLLSLLPGVRSRGDERWIARCPAHKDSSPSLTIRQTAGRILIYCWAGCTAAGICAALGITLADLYHHRLGTLDPVAIRRRRAAENLESWKQSELRRVAEELRGRDAILRAIDTTVAEGKMTEAEAWISLGYELNGYSELEYRFNRLLRNDGVLELWRKSRAA
jgi:hypothetical protein